MHKYLITRNTKRRFYSYKDSNIYTLLNVREAEAVLVKLLDMDIKNVSEYGTENEKARVFFSDGSIISIDNKNVFLKDNSKLDTLMQNLGLKIVNFISEKDNKKFSKKEFEKENIKELASKYPNGYHIKVNRNKKIAERCFATGLSFALIACLSTELKESKKDIIEDISYEPKIENYNQIAFSIPNMNITYSEINADPVETINDTVTFSIEDWTKTGKLDKTIELYGDVINYYATRYGIPTDFCEALITQERPNDFNNMCQITYKFFVGENMHVPIYDEQGFTGTYDDFLVTEDMLNSPEGNIRVGISYYRKCIEKCNSLLTGATLYNQGNNSLSAACNYYQLNIEDYKGDNKAIEASELINKYYLALNGKQHGDPNYLANVLRYLPMEDRGNISLNYYIGNDLKTVDLVNNNVYNNGLAR